MADGISVGAPDDCGFDERLLSRLFKDIVAESELIHGAVFARHGKLFAEAYSGEFGADVLHPLLSVCKSIASLLLGIAIQQGQIESEDTHLLDFFPEIDEPDKREIRLSHVLTHTSGIDWCELGIPYDEPANSHSAMENSPDWMRFVLTRPMAHAPGDVFVYNTGAYHLLSSVLQRATDIPADIFAEKFLFNPLGIEKLSWTRDAMGFPCIAGSAGGLSLAPRSLLKIGLMILDGGFYDDKEIVDNGWLERSMSPVVLAERGLKYGYGWWSWQIRGIQCFSARGYGGQALVIVPELDFAAVFTGLDLAKTKLWEKIFHRLLIEA